MYSALFTILAAAVAVSSRVSVVYPLADQLPLIARTGQPYSWSFSPDTFHTSDNVTLFYNTSSLPTWLSFDRTTRTLHGTPSPEDEGRPDITITAYNPNSDDADSDDFALCVTPYPAPVVNVPIKDQLNADNTHLSSVFLLGQNSVLATGDPALRIPPGWSFSIGFQDDTFKANDSLYYAASQADGSPLPSWVRFNPKEVTFDGIAPSDLGHESQVVSVLLHAADQEGYSATSLPFDLLLASHELSQSAMSLPTINITASTAFNVDLNSAVDFNGVLIDGNPIQPANITDLNIDISQYSNWLQFNSTARILSGTPPIGFQDDAAAERSPTLPVQLRTAFNQSLRTNLSLAVVPSFFATANLDPILVEPGQQFLFNLAQYFSNNTALAGPAQNGDSDVDLSASFTPGDAEQYMDFNSQTAHLSGAIPTNASDLVVNYDHITATFTAYSHITHSTSHATLVISLTESDFKHERAHDKDLKNKSRAKLLLGLEITFGTISGLVLLGVILAALRRCTRMEDSAIVGEAATRAWTDKEKQWYGLDEYSDQIFVGQGSMDDKDVVPDHRTNYARSTEPGKGHHDVLGLSLRHNTDRTSSNGLLGIGFPRTSVMSKAEFLGKLRTTVRKVSDKYRSTRDSSRRPTISKPTLVLPQPRRVDGLPGRISALDSLDVGNHVPSDVMTLEGPPSSVSGLTEDKSIPKRRADFVPMKHAVPLLVHAQESRTHGTTRHAPRRSTDSIASFAPSLVSHEDEAVVQTATKAKSIKSTKSLSCLSFTDSPVIEACAKPRLVPFTSATRVPVPTSPASLLNPRLDPAKSPRRIGSQKANIVSARGASGETVSGQSVDDLSVEMHYVRTLGEESTHSQSLDHGSFFSVESSKHSPVVPRILIRTGEKFRFRVSINPITSSVAPRKLTARLITGKSLPKFIQLEPRVDREDFKGHEAVQFSGVPKSSDIGELNVGVYAEGSGECVGRVIVEVVVRS